MISSSSAVDDDDALSRIASSPPPFPLLPPSSSIRRREGAKEGDRRHEEEEEEEEAPSFPIFTPRSRVVLFFRAADDEEEEEEDREDADVGISADRAPTTALMTSRLFSLVSLSRLTLSSHSLSLSGFVGAEGRRDFVRKTRVFEARKKRQRKKWFRVFNLFFLCVCVRVFSLHLAFFGFFFRGRIHTQRHTKKEVRDMLPRRDASLFSTTPLRRQRAVAKQQQQQQRQHLLLKKKNAWKRDERDSFSSFSLRARFRRVDDDDEEASDGADATPPTVETTTVSFSRRQAVLVLLTSAVSVGRPREVESARARETTVVEGSTTATSGTIKGSVILPSGYHKTKGARSRIQTTSSSDAVKITNGEKDLAGDSLEFEVQYANASANDEVTVNALVYFCQDDDVCLSRNVSFRAKVLDGDASSSSSVVDLTYSIPTPEPEMSFVVPQFE